MIRLAVEEDFLSTDFSESLLRIHALKRIYSLNVSFLRFYADGEGSLLSLMDGNAVFYACQPVSEEWLHFIDMQPEIRTVHTDVNTGQQLCRFGGWSERTGPVLEFTCDILSPVEEVCESPYLPAVYALLAENFESLPSFDAWYVDFSHRVRHGHCHIAAVMEGERVVSVATTVAETENCAILGQVATDAACRRRGYASRCLISLINRLQGKRLYILPINITAQATYENLGFSPCGLWAELKRTEETVE